MDFLFNSQVGLFLIYISSGILICLLFDIFRALRRSIKTIDIITYIEDIIFWIIVSSFLMFLIFTLNSGNIRFYIFLALFIGGLLYYCTISKYFLNFSTKIFTLLKKIIKKLILLLLIPVKIFMKMNKKIICFLCINLQNMSKIFKKFPKILKKEKTLSNKKGI